MGKMWGKLSAHENSNGIYMCSSNLPNLSFWHVFQETHAGKTKFIIMHAAVIRVLLWGSLKLIHANDEPEEPVSSRIWIHDHYDPGEGCVKEGCQSHVERLTSVNWEIVRQNYRQLQAKLWLRTGDKLAVWLMHP
jgi:hypothetical protein